MHILSKFTLVCCVQAKSSLNIQIHVNCDEDREQIKNNFCLFLCVSVRLSALLREPQRRSPSSRPQLEIYSAAGVAITSFPVGHLITDQSASVPITRTNYYKC